MSKRNSIRSEMIPQLRAACLSHFVDVARRLGLDPYELLRGAKIRPDDLADPETRISATAVVRLVEAMARQGNCDAVGVLLAEPRQFSSLGPISLLLQHRDTVRAAMESIVKHQRLLGDITDYTIEDEGDFASLRVTTLPGFGQRQAVEFAVALIFRVLSEMTGGRWRPDGVHFRHSAPVDTRLHKRFFQCPVRFDSEFDGISCSSASLAIANPAASEAMARHAEACLELLATRRVTTSVTDQVRRAINSLISRCNVTMESVADNLGLHPRMLQRLLEKEGATFAALLNETRRELARRYLANSNQSVTDVGLLLGYSTLSSFSRWFTIEFGKSPAAWRNSERGVPTFGLRQATAEPRRAAVTQLRA